MSSWTMNSQTMNLRRLNLWTAISQAMILQKANLLTTISPAPDFRPLAPEPRRTARWAGVSATMSWHGCERRESAGPTERLRG